MDTNKMREQFETWARQRYNWHLQEDARDPEDKTLSSWDGHKYGNRVVEGMWQAWQASREAVVVELPELRSVPDRDCWSRTNGLGFNNALKEARQVIEAQGLKVEVKP